MAARVAAVVFGALLSVEAGVGLERLDKIYMNIMFAWGIGGTELIVIAVAVLILFGSKKIPEFAKGLGQGIKEFKKATREVTDEIQNTTTDAPPPAKPAASSQSQPSQAVSQPPTPPKA
jgi:sec-independent protein translocase protein TatA